MIDGAKRREDRRFELAMFTAWQTERFAREERLKPFGKYLPELGPAPISKKQTPAEQLAALRAIKIWANGPH